ncbi:351R [Invertebrate iridescent virus 6]|uniref:351R n=1 Tax=Invertebrate iridescent virus 6 TaxID=176652 RepID=Q91FH3_IIV6|nr:351R [Invertebrate iridescent virus 6]AAK82212.1 351R [Invertebrate iridescent virus 6]QMS79346.1 hypothetical protein IIV6-T1_344 [Invertebrate iridescent virus 6]
MFSNEEKVLKTYLEFRVETCYRFFVITFQIRHTVYHVYYLESMLDNN